MKIASWNVNSVRARIINVLDYLKKDKPDILFLQEIKTENINFPSKEFKKMGYDSYVFGQKSYNGVAFLAKTKMDNIKFDFIEDELKQSRIICGDIVLNKTKIKIINIYVPNGKNVNKGDVIGAVGKTGRSTGAHLDIRLNLFDLKLDPASVLNIN